MDIVVDFALAALFVVVVWWSSTGFIFALNNLPERTYAWSITGAALCTPLAAAELVGAGHGRGDAALTFLAAITIWGFIEMAFLMGFVTGPRREPCPVNCGGWQRFRFACLAIAYHEALIVAALALVCLLSPGGVSSMAALAFGLLWLMRLSTKLNIFFGVPNPAAEFLPRRISFLRSYFRCGPMNALFPVTVTMATLATGYLLQCTVAAPAGSTEATEYAMLATLSALGMIEHWFLVLPFQSQVLWGMKPAFTADAVPVPSTTERGSGAALAQELSLSAMGRPIAATMVDKCSIQQTTSL